MTVGFTVAATPTCWTTWAWPVRVAFSLQDGRLTLGTRLRGGRTHLGIGLRDPHRGLCLGRDLRLLTLVARPGHQSLGPDRIVFRLHYRLNWSLEARASGDAAQLQASDFQAEDAAERFCYLERGPSGRRLAQGC